MEKQRSFFNKPTRFVVISITLSFSFLLLSFFILWVVYFHPIAHQSSYLLLSTPSLSVNFQSLTNLTDTHFGKDDNFKGFVDLVANSSVDSENKSNLIDTHFGKDGKLKGFVDLVANFSVDDENLSNLIDTHLRESSNASGFVVKSKGNVVEVELERKRVSGEVSEVGYNDSLGQKQTQISTTLVLNDEDMKESELKYVQIGNVNEVGYNDSVGQRQTQSSTTLVLNDQDMKENELKSVEIGKFYNVGYNDRGGYGLNLNESLRERQTQNLTTLVLNDQDVKESEPKYVQIGKVNEVGYNDRGSYGLNLNESLGERQTQNSTTLGLNGEDMKENEPKFVQKGKINEVGYNDKGSYDSNLNESIRERPTQTSTTLGLNDEDVKESEAKYGQIDNVNEVFEKKGVVVDCDISKGKWVFDESYPLYTNMTCPFIDEGFNCMGNGRIDNDYMKWRWQPQGCDLPRFNATNMLELIRGKRVVFAGDSINRNQWESLLCLLMGAVKDPGKVYETRGRRITKEKGVYSIRFVEYQCMVEFYVTHFLVHETKARIGKKRKETLRIDSITKGSSKWRGADILIFNTGNWWTHFKTKAGINYYQEGKQVHPHLDAETAYRKALETWATWVDRYIDPLKTNVFFRSTAPAHFRGGQWNNGGHCREARKPLNEMYIENPTKDLIAEEVIKTMKIPVTFLNVTGLSSYRIDGHPSKYGRNPTKGISSGEDCSHWCLPGVPDVWNELIYYQLLLKHKKSVIGASL